MDFDRRDFLRLMAALSLGGWAAQPGKSHGSQGGGATGKATGQGDYKALVCIFLQGGNDSANFVIPTDDDSWGRYQLARGVGPESIALAPPGTKAVPGGLAGGSAAALGGVIPIGLRTPQPWPDGTKGTGSRTFALHPLLTGVSALYGAGKVAIVANVGPLVEPLNKDAYLARAAKIPRSLFSHSDQMSTWQTGGLLGNTSGWGGLMADSFSARNQGAAFSTISLSGNALFLTGRNVRGYQTTPQGAVAIHGLAGGTLFGNAGGSEALRDLLVSPTRNTPFQSAMAEVASRSINAQQQFDEALAQTPSLPLPPPLTDPWTGQSVGNSLALALRSIASMMGAAPILGMKRQIFFVSHGGYDTHLGMNRVHPRLMAELDGALDYFQHLLGSVNGLDLTQSVTTFTMSEFGRCFVSNGSGTDHGWGGHHLVMGGAVRGGDMYGPYPTIGVDGPDFTNPGALPYTGALIPTLSVEQFAAPLGAWMGLDPGTIQGVFPNLANFPADSRGGPSLF